MKKMIAIILALCLLLPLGIAAFAAQKQLSLDAKAAVLMDINSGKVLYTLGENARLYPASITKVMSLLLVMEAVENGKIKLTDKVSASKNAASFGGSQIWLEEGEQMSVDDMIKAVTVASANDACTALGEYISGSSEAFVEQMNRRAESLGMHNTHFENCTGLDESEKNHYSSALDIAIMSRALMKYELIQKYSTIWMDSLRGGKTELVNTNRLVRFYSGCIGLKTGTTTKAGFCVSAVAEREGTRLCAVILGAKNSDERFRSAARLLDYGFANFETVTPRMDISQAGEIRVEGGERDTLAAAPEDASVQLTVPKGEGNQVITKVRLQEALPAPIEKGQTVGKAAFYLGKECIGSVKIVAAEQIGKLTFWQALKKLLGATATNLK